MKKYKEYEAIEYMLLRNTIEEIPINDLKILLTLPIGEKHNDYTYKNLLNGKGIAYRAKKGQDRSKIILVKCVKNYYDFKDIDNSSSSSNSNSYTTDTCDHIKTILFNHGYDSSVSISFDDYSFINNNCVECHKKCLELLDTNKITKL